MSISEASAPARLRPAFIELQAQWHARVWKLRDHIGAFTSAAPNVLSRANLSLRTWLDVWLRHEQLSEQVAALNKDMNLGGATRNLVDSGALLERMLDEFSLAMATRDLARRANQDQRSDLAA